VVDDNAHPITVTLADGGGVTWSGAAEPTKTVTLPGLGSQTVLPNGWINLNGATVTDALGNVVPSLLGKEVTISYTGWSEQDYVPAYVGTSPASAVAPGILLPAERQQIPVGLGYNLGGAVVAGQTAVVGALAAPALDPNAADTLLSVFWDPVSHFVKGWASQPAYTSTGNAPGILGTPTTAGGRVYAGCSGVSGFAGGIPTLDGTGYVGCLSPRRTIICAGNRLVETTGSDRTWVLTGSKAFIYGRTAPEPELTQAFSHPARASELSEGSFLVVDSGNNRVITIDRTGQQTWPLDEDGNDYYSSPSRVENGVSVGNYCLKLSQPADAYRYTDSAGNLHTVIADTGHNRVIDVVTTLQANGGQVHQVFELTPSHVRPQWDPTHWYSLRYTKAQPIFDFNNGNVIGYLCAAANIDRIVVVEAGTKNVDPDPSTTPPGGTRLWSDWLALYNAPGVLDPTITWDVQKPPTPKPVNNWPVLKFPNLRDVEYFRYGNKVYVMVTAGGMMDLQHSVADNQDGVWMWRIDTVNGPDAGVGAYAAQGCQWFYDATSYATTTGAFGQIVTPSSPAVTQYPKRFYPVCAKMLFPGQLFGGNVLITNYTGVIGNLARPNVGSRGSGLYGEVFEVNPANVLQTQRLIPDPYGTDWNDPLNQPAYAERY
jgi:hypothetical protein